MSQWQLRPWRESDLPALRSLWADAFGDDEAYIRAFHEVFLRPGSCIVAQAEDQVVSAMYILEGPLLFPPADTAMSAAYVYALATDREWRGQGIGTAVYQACVRAALERQDTVCVLPAEQSLRDFYAKASGARTISYIREGVLYPEQLQGLSCGKAAAVSAGEYYLRRKSLLRGLPYTVLSGPFLTMEDYTMRRSGGGFFSVEGDIAAVEMEGDVCRVQELLAPGGDWMEVLAALAARLPARVYQVRTPVFLPGPDKISPFMMATFPPRTAARLPEGLWWGFAFD